MEILLKIICNVTVGIERLETDSNFKIWLDIEDN